MCKKSQSMLRIYRPVAAFGLGFNLDAIDNGCVDSQAIALLVVPAQREHLAWTQVQHEEHSHNEPVAVAQMKEHLRNLLRG